MAKFWHLVENLTYYSSLKTRTTNYGQISKPIFNNRGIIRNSSISSSSSSSQFWPEGLFQCCRDTDPYSWCHHTAWRSHSRLCTNMLCFRSIYWTTSHLGYVLRSSKHSLCTLCTLRYVQSWTANSTDICIYIIVIATWKQAQANWPGCSSRLGIISMGAWGMLWVALLVWIIKQKLLFEALQTNNSRKGQSVAFWSSVRRR